MNTPTVTFTVAGLGDNAAEVGPDVRRAFSEDVDAVICTLCWGEGR